MSAPGPAKLLHPALAPGAGSPLSPERLTDRERLAVVLQGAALLSHLDLAGRRLEGGWEPARRDADGLLRGLRSAPGRDVELPQRRLGRLLARLFGGELPPAGRGQARLAARRLWRRLRPELLPAAPDRSLRLLLDAAPFLWEPRFGAVRAALAGEHRRADGVSVWVAGPGWFRRRIVDGAAEPGAVEERLRSAAAGRVWRDGSPVPSGRGPSEGRLRRARAFARQGRHRTALEVLARLRSAEARVLRVRCLAGLGRLEAARRLLATLERERLEPALVLAAAETAVRVLGQCGELDQAAVWARRALALGSAVDRRRVEMLGAAAAWDRGDGAAMERHLRLARPALDDPGLAWRWRQLKALDALARGDGGAVVEQLRRALAESRRRLTPVQAAGLWNELGIGRALLGDLAGAERALRHAAGLLDATEGPRRVDLALWNLAELRLRRGRFAGVASIAEEAAARNRRRGNWRAWAHDQELRVRLQLARGRPAAALSEAQAALARLRGLGLESGGLHAQAARALGWLGRPDEARRHLSRLADVTGTFEPEERPALWLHAGDRERARTECGGHPLARLWRPLLAGGPIDGAGWRRLEQAGPYRAARFVYDAERALPGSLPIERVRTAAARLRRLGASGLAAGLDAREKGAWSAVVTYLRSPAPGVPEVRRLLREAGAPESRLIWRRGQEERVLVDGPGGDERLTAACGAGRLELACRGEEGPLRTVLELAARDLEADLKASRGASGRAVGPRIVGSSRALREALERVDKLAASSLPILIEGETGTGKELVARRIHETSPRRRRPLLAINCAALPEGLLQAELFGHRKGAFTGADRDRPGIFESVEGGTAFLDEIGDLPLEAQGALLRVLQESEVRRLGENHPRTVEFRLVTATHRDLAAMVRGGSFREDLLYRLKGASVRLPPLRERGLDLLTLAADFLHELAPGRGLELSEAARAAILGHSWPGNVRELRNRLRLAAALADREILPRHLDLPRAVDAGRGLYHQRIDEVRAQLVRDALTAAEGNQAAAARRLGITRQAFSYLVRKFELT